MVSWAAFLGWINLHGTWASWVGNLLTVVILSVLAVAELVNDKLPKTPARTAPPVFAARIIMGGFAGAVIGTAWGYNLGGLGAGIIGAVLGTLGGYQARTPAGGRDAAAMTCRSRCSKMRSRSWAASPSLAAAAHL